MLETLDLKYMLSIRLDQLKNEFIDVEIQYLDILNYEIARENICNYIFFLLRQKKVGTRVDIDSINDKINALIYIRDNLQIADKDNVSLVLSELIPEYKRKVKETLLKFE